MTDFQIDYFIAVAEELSFTRASEKMAVTQPVISRQIAALENELGCALFDRAKKQPKLTPAGEIFLPFFRDQKIQLRNTLQKAKAAMASMPCELHIGHLDGWSLAHFLPQLKNKLIQDYPNIKIQIEGDDLPLLLSGFKNGHLDIVFALEDIVKEFSEFMVQEITAIPRILLFSAQAPQAKINDPRLEDFTDSIFFGLKGSYENYIETLCQQLDFKPAGIEIMPNIFSALQAVQNGFGVILTDLWTNERANKDFRYIQLNRNETISIVWNKDNPNPLIPVFINELTKFLH
jgi:DNA-binding transcriptional LysR family regulator